MFVDIDSKKTNNVIKPRQCNDGGGMQIEVSAKPIHWTVGT
jgi:hypothetical protein